MTCGARTGASAFTLKNGALREKNEPPLLPLTSLQLAYVRATARGCVRVTDSTGHVGAWEARLKKALALPLTHAASRLPLQAPKGPRYARVNLLCLVELGKAHKLMLCTRLGASRLNTRVQQLRTRSMASGSDTPQDVIICGGANKSTRTDTGLPLFSHRCVWR